jgi:hypothetical protein
MLAGIDPLRTWLGPRLDFEKHCQKYRRNVYNFARLAFAITRHLRPREGCTEQVAKDGVTKVFEASKQLAS